MSSSGKTSAGSARFCYTCGLAQDLQRLVAYTHSTPPWIATACIIAYISAHLLATQTARFVRRGTSSHKRMDPPSMAVMNGPNTQNPN